jgi:hypothetical protein
VIGPQPGRVQVGSAVANTSWPLRFLRGRESRTTHRPQFDANPGKVHDVRKSKEFLARFDAYHGTSPLDFRNDLTFEKLADQPKIAFEKPTGLTRFAFASPHSADSQYLRRSGYPGEKL